MNTIHNHKSLELRGKGTVIAIIDSGICTKFDLLSSKKIEGYNLLQGNWDVPLNDNTVPNECKHCTVVASIIGGKYKNGASYGIAPEADLYICKVMNNKSKVKVDDLLEALQHILDIKTSGKKDVDVVSVSLGFERMSERVELVLKKLTESGVVVVASAGNDGSYQRNPTFPASNSLVLSVGALNPKGDISSLNPPHGIDVYLPGKDIEFPNEDTKELFGGSSCAAPMLAGLLSLLIQWAKDRHGSKKVLAKYHDVNFLRSLLHLPLLSDPGGVILRISDFFCDIISKGENHVLELINQFYSDFKDEP